MSLDETSKNLKISKENLKPLNQNLKMIINFANINEDIKIKLLE